MKKENLIKFRQNKTFFENQKGITLITLVITIIILLILAGISINAVFGENGLISKSKEAVKRTEVETQREYLEMEVVAYIMEYGSLEDGQDFVNKLETGWNYIEEDQKYVIVKSPNKNSFKVGKGKLGTATYIPEGASLYQLAGTGTKSDPYLVQTVNDLDTIARSIEGILEEETGQDFSKEGVYIELTKDLDFNNENDYFYPGDKEVIKARFKGIGYKLKNSFEDLTLIAMAQGIIVNSNLSIEEKQNQIKDALDTLNIFYGIFDGMGHSILNYENENGLFGFLAPGASIKNLSLVDVNIHSSEQIIVGGIAQVIAFGTIENCKVTGSIQNSSPEAFDGGTVVGGVVGSTLMSTVDSSVNLASINSLFATRGFSWCYGAFRYFKLL